MGVGWDEKHRHGQEVGWPPHLIGRSVFAMLKPSAGRPDRVEGSADEYPVSFCYVNLWANHSTFMDMEGKEGERDGEEEFCRTCSCLGQQSNRHAPQGYSLTIHHGCKSMEAIRATTQFDRMSLP